MSVTMAQALNQALRDAMTADDQLRSDIIQSLMCHGRVDLVALVGRGGRLIQHLAVLGQVQPLGPGLQRAVAGRSGRAHV